MFVQDMKTVWRRATAVRKARTRSARPGATMVEFAAVAIVFVMLLFGIIEYCRFIFLKQIVTNAARDGARFAVVNTLEGNMEAETLARVKKQMSGMDTKYANYKCEVYKADKNGAKTGTAADAKFGEYVAVELSINFETIVPSLLLMNKTIKVQTKALMYCEAN